MFSTFEEFNETLKLHFNSHVAWILRCILCVWTYTWYQTVSEVIVESACCAVFELRQICDGIFCCRRGGFSTRTRSPAYLLCYRDCSLTTLGYTKSVALWKVTKTRTSLIHVWFTMMSLRSLDVLTSPNKAPFNSYTSHISVWKTLCIIFRQCNPKTTFNNWILRCIWCVWAQTWYHTVSEVIVWSAC